MRKPVLAVLAGVALVLAGGDALAAGDAAVGADVFKKQCTTCHSNEQGVHKVGPSLYGIYGSKAGSSNFPRYKGLVGADFTWNDALLDEYLADPKAFVVTHTQNKTTAMTYKVKDAKDREDVIAYLKTLK